MYLKKSVTQLYLGNNKIASLKKPLLEKSPLFFFLLNLTLLFSKNKIIFSSNNTIKKISFF